MTSETQKISRSYRNHQITFNPDKMNFIVSGPEFEQYKETYCMFGSYDEAITKITAEVEASAKLRAKNIKLQETIITETGEPKEITAIHRGSGDINGVQGRYVYPNIPWIKDALSRRRAARLEIDLRLSNPKSIRNVSWRLRIRQPK